MMKVKNVNLISKKTIITDKTSKWEAIRLPHCIFEKKH